MMIHFHWNVILVSLYGLDKSNIWKHLEKYIEPKYVGI